MNTRCCLIGAFLIVAPLFGCRASEEPPAAKRADRPVPTPLPHVANTKGKAPVRYELCSKNLPTSGFWKSDPEFADVNGDGFFDLAALPRLGNGPRIWLGDGKGGWTEASDGLSYSNSCGGGLKFGDVNKDGHLDLVIADHCQGVFVYLGNGKGQWSMVVRGLHPPPPEGKVVDLYVGSEDVALGDVNGDGHLDIVTGASDHGGVNVYLGNGTGTEWNRSSKGLPFDTWANRVTLADVNKDGALDIVAGHNHGPRVFLNNRDGTWKASSEGLPTPLIGGLYFNVEVADMNSDGLPDLVAANWIDGPELYLQQGDGSWKKQPDIFPEMNGGSTALAIGDIDGDGHTDIVVAGRLTSDPGFSRGVFALYNDGTGKMRFAEPSGFPSTGLAAFAGATLFDFTGNGLLDVAIGSGLIVESAPGPTEPILAPRLIVWCTHPANK